MKPFAGPLPALLAAAALVAGATIVQGMWTERWTSAEDGGRLERAGRLLERAFPDRFAGWETRANVPTDPRELERAGAVGHVSRLYRNAGSGVEASVFVVCATPKDASSHTPDRCYLAAGFEIRETEHREQIPLADGRQAEAFVATFAKGGQTLRIFWTYGVEPRADEAAGATGPWEWIAPPGIARIALSGRGPVYKLYVILDDTRLGSGRAQREGFAFIGELLPAFGRSAAADPGAGAPKQPADEPPAAAPGRDGLRKDAASAKNPGVAPA